MKPMISSKLTSSAEEDERYFVYLAGIASKKDSQGKIMIKEFYLYYKDIQDRLMDYHRNTAKKMLVSEAMVQLQNENKAVFQPVYPDFSMWDIHDLPQLQELFEQMPINITPILSNPHRYSSFVSEDYAIPSSINGIISLYMKQEETKLHWHDFFEILYVLSGTCVQYFESEKRTLGAGEFCIIAPYTKHDIVSDDGSIVLYLWLRKSNFKTTFFNILESDNILSNFFNNSLYNSSKNYLLFMTTPTPQVLSILKNILIESVSTRPFSGEVATCYISILFSEILRSYSKTHCYYPLSKTHKIPIILDYIKENYRYINLTRAAEFFSYTPDYLGKLIKQNTGMNFNDIINQYKIEQATYLLQYTDYTVDDIAEEVGFGSADHFSRTFRKARGFSPSQYRKQVRETVRIQGHMEAKGKI